MRYCRYLFLVSLAVLAVLWYVTADKTWWHLTPEEWVRLEQHRIRGIAALENQHWNKALEEFEAIRRERPLHPLGWINSALVRRWESQHARAISSARKAVSLRPRDARLRLVLAYLLGGEERLAEVSRELRTAAALAPTDVRVLAALERHLNEWPRPDQRTLHELRWRIMRLEPDNPVAQFHWAEVQLERRDYQGALETLTRVWRLLPPQSPYARQAYVDARQGLSDGSPVARVALRIFKNSCLSKPEWRAASHSLYGDPGNLADLLVRDWNPAPPRFAPPPLPPVKIGWTDVTVHAGLGGLTAPGMVPLAVGDVDHGRDAGRYLYSEKRSIPKLLRPDLAVAGPSPGLLLNTPRGFRTHPAPPLVSGSPLLADLDSDGSLDLYAVGPAGDRVWRNPWRSRHTREGLQFFLPAGARWQPFVAPGRGAGSALAADLDLDGDLDLVRVNAAAGQQAVRYLRNEGELRLTDATRDTGLEMRSCGARQAVFGDFDGNATPDLFIVRSAAACRLFLNSGSGALRLPDHTWGLSAAPGAGAAAVADFDRDGDWDLVVAGHPPHGAVLYRNAGRRFERETGPAMAALTADWVEVLDYDNDSWLDLALAGPKGLTLLRNDGGRLVEAAPAALQAPCRWVKALDYDRDGDRDLLAVTAAGGVRLLRNEGGHTRPWLRLELRGLQSAAGFGVNLFGIGSVVELQTVWDRQKILVTEPEIHVGLGRSREASAVRVLFTGRGSYSGMDVRTGESRVITQVVPW